ncbi:unnamed protein product [Victoria cruziana]
MDRVRSGLFPSFGFGSRPPLSHKSEFAPFSRGWNQIRLKSSSHGGFIGKRSEENVGRHFLPLFFFDFPGKATSADAIDIFGQHLSMAGACSRGGAIGCQWMPMAKPSDNGDQEFLRELPWEGCIGIHHSTGAGGGDWAVKMKGAIDTRVEVEPSMAAMAARCGYESTPILVTV